MARQEKELKGSTLLFLPSIEQKGPEVRDNQTGPTIKHRRRV